MATQRIHTTYNWYTIKQDYHIKCDSCNKKYKRTESIGYNELADREARQRYRDKLCEDVQKIEQKYKERGFICDKCAISKIDFYDEATPIQEYLGEELLSKIEAAHQAYNQAMVLINEINSELGTKLPEGQILKYKDIDYGNEYGNTLHISTYNSEFDIRVSCNKINKKQKWLLTEEDFYKTNFHKIDLENLFVVNDNIKIRYANYKEKGKLPKMINIIKKDITTINSPAIIMHGVNCQGKMGSGVAKALFTKWSDVREKYLTIPVDKMELGLTQIVNVEKDLYVANCFTQEFYGYDGKKYADETAILKCLFDVTALANCLKIYDIYSPKIGCGLGGLNWEEDVFCQFQNVSRMDYNFNFYICEI